jgi:hypothetical protein
MLMPPHIAGIIANDHGRELRERAAVRVARGRSTRRARLGRRLRRERTDLAATPALEAAVTIRLARRADEPALRRLAELDSRRVPDGEVLVAVLGDELVAARSLDGAGSIADPFLPTSGLVALLDVRAEQLRQVAERPAGRVPAPRRRPAVARDR